MRSDRMPYGAWRLRMVEDKQGCYACTPTIKVPDNREVRDNKRRDFRCSKSAMHEPDVGPGERSLRLPARSL